MGSKVKTEEAIQEAGRYFRHMAQFVGFTEEDAAAIKASQLIIEKSIPEIVGQFYDHLLGYPPTRKYFLDPNGEVDQEYLRLRMVHNTTFWRRAASGEFDDDFAYYIHYVGLAHTSQGADPKIYIPERYVIGQMGFVSHAISAALARELHELDPELENKSTRAWNLLLMVILEMLARAYRQEEVAEDLIPSEPVDSEQVRKLAVDTYERGLGLYKSIKYEEQLIGRAEDIPDGERLIVQVGELSIGVFHHRGNWHAVRNHCLHRAGPVATGDLAGNTLTCPWHGYQYNLITGEYLNDPSVCLDTYQVEERDGELILRIPRVTMGNETPVSEGASGDKPGTRSSNTFRVADLPAGGILRVEVGGEPVAVYNLDGDFYATQDRCTHAGGSLCEGELEGDVVICPVHRARFDVRDGSVVKGPAKKTLRTYKVRIEGPLGHVK